MSTKGGLHFGPTTLEQALTHAYNLQIADGTWARTFGRSSLSDFRADNFCTGSVDGWPVPTVEPGTDLARVILGNEDGSAAAADDAVSKNATFHCGFLEDSSFVTPTGEVMMITGKEDNVTGAVVDFWEGLVQKLGSMYETELTLQWKLYPSAQDVLDALQSGELDAGCGFWNSDGTWTDPATGNDVARGLAFSVHTCPIAIQTEFIWALNESNITSFQDLIDKIKAGEVTRVCSSTSPGGGTEANCRATLQLYSQNENVTCEGVRTASFGQVMAGNCSAAWAGLPTGDERPYFQNFPQPTASARVTYLRSTDVQNMKTEHHPSDATGRYFERTTLEQAVIRVFNEKVSDGAYASAISGLTGIESVSFCVGSYESWLLPEPVEGSDLKAVLDRGVFRCGYPRDRVVATTDGAILIDTSSSATGGEDVVTGRIADFWNNDLIPALGALYNTTLRIQWILHDFEVSTFNQLHSGEIDAACALFNADGSWVSTDLGSVVARPLVFSPMYCPAFLQTSNIYTLKNSSWSTFEGLVEGVADGSVTEICVSDDVTGGTVNTCADTMKEYTGKEVECRGSTATDNVTATQLAFNRMKQELCEAVWGGVLPAEQSAEYQIFPQPTLLVPVSFFRNVDVEFRDVDGGGAGGTTETDGTGNGTTNSDTGPTAPTESTTNVTTPTSTPPKNVTTPKSGGEGGHLVISVGLLVTLLLGWVTAAAADLTL